MADIWSCGVVLFVLLTGYLPFEEENMSKLFHKISLGEYVCPAWVSEEAKALLCKILVPDPKRRIRMEGIRRDAWMVGGEEGREEGRKEGMVVGSTEMKEVKEEKEEEEEEEDGNGFRHHQHDEQEEEGGSLRRTQAKAAAERIVEAEGEEKCLSGRGEAKADPSSISDEEGSHEGALQRRVSTKSRLLLSLGGGGGGGGEESKGEKGEGGGGRGGAGGCEKISETSIRVLGLGDKASASHE